MPTATQPIPGAPSQAPQDPALGAIRESFRRIKEEARSLTDGLNAEAFNWQPAPGRWSIAQCLAHLHVAGELLLPRLKEAIAQAEAQGRTREKPAWHGFFGRRFIRANEPNPKRKLKTPSAYVPPARHAPDVLVPDFLKLQNDLIACTEQADGLDLTSFKVASPAARLVRFDVPTWLAVTEAHERRHLAQAQDVRNGDAFPT